MGVAGAGKSTIGAVLAQRLARPFLDADTLHPPANIAKMTAGEALTDDDRYPWLDRVGEWLNNNRDGIVGCSALTRAYRDRLRAHCSSLRFVHLDGPVDLIGQRMAARSGHFMSPGLLQSQFDTLERLSADEDGFVVELTASQDVQRVVQVVEAFLTSATSAAGDCCGH